MQNLKVIETRGMRVLTSAQIAACYETTCDRIKQNFKENKARFIEGKHYIALVGEALKTFKSEVGKYDLVTDGIKNEVENPKLVVDKAAYQFNTQFKYAKSLYLWTEKGALLHAKSLNTDKAWEVYDYLVEFYFRIKDEKEKKKEEIVPVTVSVEPLKDKLPLNSRRQKMQQDAVNIFKILMKAAEKRGVRIKTADFKISDSRLKENRIGVRRGLPLECVNYEVAYELFHHAVNYDQGNIIDTPLADCYSEQAERAASFIIELLDIGLAQ